MTTTVSTTDYRANLKHWHELAASGEDVLVTDRDRVVVRVSAPAAETSLDRLERDGLLRRGRPRPRSADVPSIPAPGDSTTVVSRGRDR